MTDADWWMLYAPLTVGTVAITIKRRPDDIMGAALTLAAVWCLYNASHWWVPHPYSQWFPLIDTVVGIGFSVTWRNRLSYWRAALIGLLLADMLFHAAYFAAGDRSHAAKYAYDLRLNLVYLAQLGTVVGARLTTRRR